MLYLKKYTYIYVCDKIDCNTIKQNLLYTYTFFRTLFIRDFVYVDDFIKFSKKFKQIILLL